MKTVMSESSSGGKQAFGANVYIADKGRIGSMFCTS